MLETDGSAFGSLDAERAYHAKVRTSRIPYVRAYAALMAVVLLAYLVVNPMFLEPGEATRFNMLVAPSLLVLGAYYGSTYWPGYPDRPIIDFSALLGLAILITGLNTILYEEAIQLGEAAHANLAISSFLVAAFAAFALSGKFRWFAIWLALHTAGFSATIWFLDQAAETRFYGIMSQVTGAAVTLFLNWSLGRSSRVSFALLQELEVERHKTEQLLYNVLPPVAAQRLKQGLVVADSFSDVSVVFIDVVGFTKLSSTVSPGHLIEMLNAFFRLADRCAADHGVEKVKTIGDAYLAISGGNAPSHNSADSAIAFAEAVIEGLEEVRDKCGISIKVRIGVHSGPVVGGVIGATRMAYDYWGETMNMASRVEGQAEPNGIAISEATFMRTRRKDMFRLPELVSLKGVGEAPVFRMKQPEPPAPVEAPRVVRVVSGGSASAGYNPKPVTTPIQQPKPRRD